MMPHHPHASRWRQKASEYQVSVFSRQTDLQNTTVVDGKPIRNWLHGYNVFPDGVLVNHNRVHPDYIVSDSPRSASMVDLSLARQPLPRSLVFNVEFAYHALTEVRFVPGASSYGTGAILAPGGTMYRRTYDGGYLADVYYPQGADWTTKVTDGYLNMDLVAKQLRLDAGKPFDALGWARTVSRRCVPCKRVPVTMTTSTSRAIG